MCLQGVPWSAGESISTHYSRFAIEPRPHARLSSRLKYGIMYPFPHTTVASLPTEILAEIFLLVQRLSSVDCELEDGQDDETVYPTLPFEVTISHVCASWRAISFSLHHFWRTIYIDSASHPQRPIAYLERSGNSLLDVEIRTSGSELGSAVLDAVFARAHMWRRCAIFVRVERHARPVASRLYHLAAPNLRYLSITMLDEQGGLPVFAPILDGGASPPQNLTFVRLAGMAFRFFVPPLAAVTTFHLDQTNSARLAYVDFRKLILSMPLLAHLSLHGNILGDTPWPMQTVGDIRLPHLVSLRICGYTGHVYSGVLLCVDAPNLASLVLKGLTFRDLDPLLVNSKSCHLVQSLTLCDVDYPIEEAYDDLVLTFPALRELNFFSHIYQVPHILKYLHDTARWQRLEKMAIILNAEEQVLLAGMLKVRLEAGFPMRKLRIITGDWLDELENQGWISERTVLETVESFPDPWPLDRNFEDDDDFLIR